LGGPAIAGLLLEILMKPPPQEEVVQIDFKTANVRLLELI
jgi:hypothetical protein